MRIKKFTPFLESISDNEADSNIMDSCCNGEWEIKDGLINVNGDFMASEKLGDRKTLGDLKFGEVTGNFDVSSNELKSLEGCPKKVGGVFNCSDNRLDNLKGGPESAGKYYCGNNFLSNIDDIALDSDAYVLSGNIIRNIPKLPISIEGPLFINDNNLLESLEGCPERVGGTVDISNCESLKSLEGCPQIIGRNFICSGNKLDSLEGGPVEVSGFYDASSNDLTDARGIAKKIGKWISLSNNNIHMLRGLEGSIPSGRGRILLTRNPTPGQFLEIQLKYLRENPKGNLDSNLWVKDILSTNPQSLFRAIPNNPSNPAFKKVMDSLDLPSISHEDNKLLSPLIVYIKDKNSKMIRDYIDSNIESFSDSFKEDYGISKDLSDLGF